MKEVIMLKLDTYAKNTWCPGCGNFAILSVVKKVFSELDRSKLVIVTGIGCHGKIADYIDVNSFYTLHGRVPPTASGIKLANPELTVVGFAGDGDAYGEGLAHLLFAAKRNTDITIIVHNNRVYGLTTGQFTPTSPEGFKGKSTPWGNIERPFNPLELVFNSGATFIARSYSNRTKNLRMVIREAIEHKGFSFVEILQPCYTYFNTYDYYNERVYELKGELGREEAEEKIREWDYNSDARIPIGIFYRERRPTYEERILNGLIPAKRGKKVDISRVLERSV
jgi:2-oxoglutarate ferredoxin oxidoreductase subunit beta